MTWLLVLLALATAQAENSYSVGISASELLTPDFEHIAIYQVASVGIFHPLSEKTGMFGDIGLEVSPAGNWGGVADLGVEQTLMPWISLDAMAMLVHDQSSLGTVFIPGGGVGLAHYTKSGVAFRMSLLVFADGSLNPSVGLGIPIPR